MSLVHLRYAFLNLSFIYCSSNLLCSKILKCLHPSAVTPLTILWLGCLTPYDSNTFHLFKICNWQCFIPNYISMSRWLLFIKLCLSWSYCIAPGRRITYFHTNLLYSVLVQLESNNPQWVGEVNHDPKRFLSWSVRYRVIFHIFVHSFQFLTDCLKKSTTLLPCYLKNSCSLFPQERNHIIDFLQWIHAMAISVSSTLKFLQYILFTEGWYLVKFTSTLKTLE